MCDVRDVVVEDLEKDGIIAFACWFAVLSAVNQSVFSCVVHSTFAEEKANDKVKIGFKKMYDSEFLEFGASRALVYHYVHDFDPSFEIETFTGCGVQKSVHDMEYVGRFLLDRYISRV